MAAGFEIWLMRHGQQAMRKLWKLANAEDTSAAQRERLLTFFAEMALGKARTMDATPKGEDEKQRSGVIILPAVMVPEEDHDAAGYAEI